MEVLREIWVALARGQEGEVETYYITLFKKKQALKGPILNSSFHLLWHNSWMKGKSMRFDSPQSFHPVFQSPAAACPSCGSTVGHGFD